MTRFDPPKPTLFTDHARSFSACRYVYPVVSRRAQGVSIGVDLSPTHLCTFRCVYCQITREAATKEVADPAEAATPAIDLDLLREEVGAMVEAVTTGRLFEAPRFAETPQPLRRLNDIALSGSGESRKATVNFGPRVGQKRFVLSKSPLRPVKR